jgi:hypothetical protein
MEILLSFKGICIKTAQSIQNTKKELTQSEEKTNIANVFASDVLFKKLMVIHDDYNMKFLFNIRLQYSGAFTMIKMCIAKSLSFTNVFKKVQTVVGRQ